MSRTVKPIADKTIQKAKPKLNEDGSLKSYTIADGNGLHLLIKTDGKKLWEFIFKSPTLQKRRKTSFGNYPQTSLKNARDKRVEYLDLIQRGIDPLDKKKKDILEIKQTANSNFQSIANEWLVFDQTRTTADTHKRKKAVFENDVYPYLKNKSINDITHQDIIEVIEKKSKQGFIESAERLFRHLNTVWRFAITKGLCKYNPFNDIMKDLVIAQKSVTHYAKITEQQKLKELIDAINSYSGHYSVKSALQFVLHLPLRADNLCHLKWSSIDFDKKMLTIPRQQMKAKNKNLPDFKMPLTDTVIEILKTQHVFTGFQEYVFLSIAGKPINKETPNRALIRMGFNDDKHQRLHSFRGTFRSLAETHQKEHNAPFEVKERALDYQETNKVIQAYTHQAEYFEQLKPLMLWWSDYLNNLEIKTKKKFK